MTAFHQSGLVVIALPSPPWRIEMAPAVATEYAESLREKVEIAHVLGAEDVLVRWDGADLCRMVLYAALALADEITAAALTASVDVKPDAVVG